MGALMVTFIHCLLTDCSYLPAIPVSVNPLLKFLINPLLPSQYFYSIIYYLNTLQVLRTILQYKEHVKPSSGLTRSHQSGI